MTYEDFIRNFDIDSDYLKSDEWSLGGNNSCLKAVINNIVL